MDVKNIPIAKIDIAEGVALHAIETDSFKTNIVTVKFITPLSAATASLHALIPPVLRRGTVSYPNTAKFTERTQELYSSWVGGGGSVYGESNIVGFNAGCLDNSFIPDGTDVFGGTLDLLREVIFTPYTENGRFKDAYVAGEKKTLVDRIKAVINDKQRLANRRLTEIMCEGEAYAVPETGSVETAEAVTPSALYDEWKNVLATAPVVIFYVGRDARANAELVAAKFREAFAGIERRVLPLPKTEVIRAAKGEPRVIIEEEPVNQGKLAIGFRSGTVVTDEDYAKFKVMLCVYGAGTMSKLFVNVREKLSLCYYCSAGDHGEKGLTFVQSGIEVDKYEEAKAEIFAQLENVKNGVFTEDEIDGAKKLLRNGCLGVTDSAWNLESWYFQRLMRGSSETPAELIAKYEAVTAEDIAAAAKKLSLDTIYFLKGNLLTGAENSEGGDE